MCIMYDELVKRRIIIEFENLINKAKDENNYIKELTVDGLLNPVFDKETEECYFINLNSDSNQDKIKDIFTKLLSLLSNDDVVLNYKVENGYSKVLFKEVCEEYIKDLNQELKSVREELKRTLA